MEEKWSKPIFGRLGLAEWLGEDEKVSKPLFTHHLSYVNHLRMLSVV